MQAGGAHYVVAPPSRLSNGAAYRWRIPLTSLESVPLLTLDETGFSRCWLPNLPRPSITELTERTEEDRCGLKRTEEQREQTVTDRKQTTTEDNQGHNHAGLIEQECRPPDEFIERALQASVSTNLSIASSTDSIVVLGVNNSRAPTRLTSGVAIDSAVVESVHLVDDMH